MISKVDNNSAKDEKDVSFSREQSQFLCALHLHTDVFPPHLNKKGYPIRHGATPRNIAKYIVNSGLDLFAITEHIQTVQGDIRNSFRRFQEVCEEVDKLKGNKKIDGKYGVELSMTTKSMPAKINDTLFKYHINLIFEKKLTEQTLPDLSDLHHLADISRFQEFQKSGGYEHISILNHPSTENFSYNIKGCDETTREIMKIVDGVEIANRKAFSKKDIPTDLFIKDILLTFEAKQEKNHLALIGSGDIHSGESEAVSTFSTIVYAEDITKIFESIRKGKTKVDIFQSPQDLVNIRVKEVIMEIVKLAEIGVLKIEKGKKLVDYCNINLQNLYIG